MTDIDNPLGMSAADLARLDALLASEGLATDQAPDIITARPGASEGPQSFAQELLWMMHEAHPGLSAYNIGLTRRIRGPVDPAIMEGSLRYLTERHESLRTTFHGGEPFPVQRVRPAGDFKLRGIDLSGVPKSQRLAAGQRHLEEVTRAPFDLGLEPAVRATLISMGGDEWLFSLVAHHIILDGWSLGILMRELSAVYAALLAGQAPRLPAVPISHGDYAAWERQTIAGERVEATLGYWRRQLDGALTTIALPADRPRSDRNDQAGGDVRRVLPPPLLDEVKSFMQASGTTLYAVMVATFQAWLSRVSGQDDIVIGSAIGGRPRPETHGVVGYFSGALPLRSRFDADPTFAELVAGVRETVLGALEHQELPVERLSMELARDQAIAGQSLFQVVLTMADPTPVALTLGDCLIEGASVSPAAAKFDLTLFPTERTDGLSLLLSYRTSLFDEASAASFLEQIETLLATAVRAPATPISLLPLLSVEAAAVQAGWNETDAWFGEELVPAQILARAAAVPKQTAVRVGDAEITYEDLVRQATQLAHLLRQQGVVPDSVVGLCLDRTPDLVVGLLGIWLAGAGYLPLLPDQPPSRIAQLLQASGARWTVTKASHRALLPSAARSIALDVDQARLAVAPLTPLPRAHPNHLAYVLFTSGSTGAPKGVAITHGNLAHYTAAVAQRLALPMDGSGRWHLASVSTLAADLGHTAVFPALASGGTLHLVPSETAMDAGRWAEYLLAHPVDLLKITPSHLRALLGDADPEALRTRLPTAWLVLGGEACPWSLVETVRRAGTCRVLNHYGPTETTVGACVFEPASVDVTRWDPASVPIGRPLPNAKARILDRRGQPVPTGVVGELYLGGLGVARGYFLRDDLTAERFSTDSSGHRWYRTGDKVRQLPTGDIEFLGRLDAQVKVRGHRVELEEIESVASQCPGVRQVAIGLFDDRLVGFLVGTAAPDDVAKHLAVRLPDYMVPPHWERLAQLPITANGKVDRKALAPTEKTVEATEPVTARTEVERQLVGLWEEVLKRRPIGIRDDFFQLGGHSLLAIRLLGKIAKTTGVRLPLRALFDAPTIEALAEKLEPTSPTEAVVGEVYAEVLKRPSITRHDDFFRLGGHSLLAIRLLARLSKATGVRLVLRALFDHPTPALLAAEIDRLRGQGAPAQPGGITRRTRDAVDGVMPGLPANSPATPRGEPAA